MATVARTQPSRPGEPEQRRLDSLPVDGEVLVGRLVLDDEDLRVGKRTILDEDKEPLCVSVLSDAVAHRWHAPVGAAPDEVLLRRRIAVRVWSIVDLTDEVDRRPAAEGEPRRCRGPTSGPTTRSWPSSTAHVGGDARHRRHHPEGAVRRDVRRLPHARGQGGPGTGKTAVGLHRAAWLVVNETEPARAGVLVVGPNPAFMTYIRAVLPTLGVDAVHQFDAVSLVASPRRSLPPTTARPPG